MQGFSTKQQAIAAKTPIVDYGAYDPIDDEEDAPDPGRAGE